MTDLTRARKELDALDPLDAKRLVLERLPTTALIAGLLERVPEAHKNTYPHCTLHGGNVLSCTEPKLARWCQDTTKLGVCLACCRKHGCLKSQLILSEIDGEPLEVPRAPPITYFAAGPLHSVGVTAPVEAPPCPDCNGRGTVSVDCGECFGTGVFEYDDDTHEDCPECCGDGYVFEDCIACGGYSS